MLEHIILAGTLITAATFALLYFKYGRGNQEEEQAALSFTTLTGVAPAGIWRTDASGNCVYVNRYWEELTGLNEERWRNSGWSEALHPEDADRVFSSFMRAVSGEQLFEDEWRWLRPDGTCRWTMCRGAPEYDDDGNFMGYIGINIDIQRAKELETDLSEALERAEQAASAKTTFLANMSHEIRTPMNGVIGFTELLLESDLTDEQFDQVRLISESGRAMMQLLNDILDVSKIESGQLRILEEPTDLRDQLLQCARLHEPMARNKGLMLNTFVDNAVPRIVNVDRLRLRQIVLNLVGNAVKFTENGGVDVEARIESSSEGPVLLISVVDTGIGIQKGKLDSIFTPFVQEDGSVARRYGGTGLGLAISSQLVTMMGGRISVHSKYDDGTNFTVRLPLKEADSEETQTKDGIPQIGAAKELAGCRVLIAEDHAINQQLIMAMIASLGVRASLAKNGEEAVAAAVQAHDAGQPFDAVLMDMQMPDVDGLEATKQLRELGFTADELPIIALTANCYPDDVAACIKAGMQSHLRKPVTTAALLDELTRWMTHAPSSGELPSGEPGANGPSPSQTNDPMEAARISLAGLEERYRDRRNELLSAMRQTLNGDPCTTDWENLAAELHKLAGIAANFGEAELGQASRRLEHDLKTVQEPRARLAALKREWPAFEEAA